MENSVFQFFSFSVFQFFSFGSGTILECLRKNSKTADSGAYKHVLVMYLIITADFFHNPKVPELSRNSSGTKTEKLKN